MRPLWAPGSLTASPTWASAFLEMIARSWPSHRPAPVFFSARLALWPPWASVRGKRCVIFLVCIGLVPCSSVWLSWCLGTFVGLIQRMQEWENGALHRCAIINAFQENDFTWKLNYKVIILPKSVFSFVSPSPNSCMHRLLNSTFLRLLK